MFICMIRYFDYKPTCRGTWDWGPEEKYTPDSETGHLTKVLKFEAFEMEIGDKKEDSSGGPNK